jgi:Leucine-rich repeat (LRR) protein
MLLGGISLLASEKPTKYKIIDEDVEMFNKMYSNNFINKNIMSEYPKYSGLGFVEVDTIVTQDSRIINLAFEVIDHPDSCIKYFEWEYIKFKYLKKLSVRGQRHAVSWDVYDCPNLESLDLRDSYFIVDNGVNFTTSFIKSPKLTYLDMSRIQWGRAYSLVGFEIDSFPNLKYLNISNNGAGFFIFKQAMNKLVEFRMDNCMFDTYKKDRFGSPLELVLPNLEIFSCANSKIQEFKGLTCKKLRTINMNNTEINKFGSIISDSLKLINFENTRFVEVSPKIENTKSIEDMNVNNSGFVLQAAYYPNLRILKADGNNSLGNFTSSNFPKLKECYLNRNKYSTFENNKLEDLEVLELDDNLLTKVPILTNYPNLKRLSIGWNKLEDTLKLENLKNINYVRATSNNLKAIKFNGIGNSFENLICDSNQIDDILIQDCGDFSASFKGNLQFNCLNPVFINILLDSTSAEYQNGRWLNVNFLYQRPKYKLSYDPTSRTMKHNSQTPNTLTTWYNAFTKEKLSTDAELKLSQDLIPSEIACNIAIYKYGINLDIRYDTIPFRFYVRNNDAKALKNMVRDLAQNDYFKWNNIDQSSDTIVKYHGVYGTYFVEKRSKDSIVYRLDVNEVALHSTWLNTAATLDISSLNDLIDVQKVVMQFRKIDNLSKLKLSKLRTLILNNCEITDSLPLLKSTNLDTLTVKASNLQGGFSSVDIPALKYLDLSNNSLNGEIPNLNLSNLRYLDLNNNRFEGKCHSLAECSGLEYLNLSKNQMSGNFELKLKNLKYLDLNQNSFDGEFNDLSFCPNLEDFNISNNNFSGELPNISNSKIKNFRASHNQFSGAVPALTSDSLIFYEVAYNQLTIMALPNYLKNCYTYNVSNNKIKGEIPMLYSAGGGSFQNNDFNSIDPNIKNWGGFWGNHISFSDWKGYDGFYSGSARERQTVYNQKTVYKLYFDTIENKIICPKDEYCVSYTWYVNNKVFQTNDCFYYPAAGYIPSDTDSCIVNIERQYSYYTGNETFRANMIFKFPNKEFVSPKFVIDNNEAEKLNLILSADVSKVYKGWPITKDTMLTLPDVQGVEFYYQRNSNSKYNYPVSYSAYPQSVLINGVPLQSANMDFDLKYLKTLKLNNCNLSEFPSKLANTIETLELSNNKFEKPVEIIKCDSLVNLSINNSHLKGGAPKLTSLKLNNINLSKNELTYLTINKNCKFIKTIDVSDNLLNMKISDLYFSDSLQIANLSNNKIYGEFNDLEFNACLKDLNLSNNNLYGEIRRVVFPTSLARLNLSKNKFSGTFSGDLFLKTITYLNLSNNTFKSGVTKEFLKNRKEFDIANNQIEDEIVIKNFDGLNRNFNFDNNLINTITIDSTFVGNLSFQNNKILFENNHADYPHLKNRILLNLQDTNYTMYYYSKNKKMKVVDSKLSSNIVSWVYSGIVLQASSNSEFILNRDMDPSKIRCFISNNNIDELCTIDAKYAGVLDSDPSDTSKSEISIYPSVASNYIIVKSYGGNYADQMIFIFNELGEKVLTAPFGRIDISILPYGKYWAVFNDGDRIVSKGFVIIR